MSIQLNDSSIKATVSPNPFLELINITASHGMDRLELYDLVGRLIFKKELEVELSYQLSLTDSNLIPGLYILRVVGLCSDDKIIRIIKG